MWREEAVFPARGWDGAVSGGSGEGAGGPRRASRWVWLEEGVAAAAATAGRKHRRGTQRSAAMGGSRAPPERLGGCR